MLRALAGTSIRFASLAANGKSSSMTGSAIAADLSKALDIKSNNAAEIAFYCIALINAVTKLCFFFLCKIFNSCVGIDAGFLKDLLCACSADAINICQADLNSFLLGKVNAGYTV